MSCMQYMHSSWLADAVFLTNEIRSSVLRFLDESNRQKQFQKDRNGVRVDMQMLFAAAIFACSFIQIILRNQHVCHLIQFHTYVCVY